jgi:hypothetical protein
MGLMAFLNGRLEVRRGGKKVRSRLDYSRRRCTDEKGEEVSFYSSPPATPERHISCRKAALIKTKAGREYF